MEKEVFVLGAWRNYDDLEESLTMDELVETSNHIIESKNREMEFQANISGAKLKKESTDQQESESSLKERIRKRKQEKQEQEAKQNNGTEFSQGVSYKVIGG